MSRMDIYDSRSSNKSDTKQIYDFDFHNHTVNTLPTSYDGGTPVKEELTTVCIDHRGETVLDREEKNEGSEKPNENLSQVWWDFLGETSLHGCKNVKERRIVKRLVWCCMILLMAISLGWALVNLFVRYQQHPFVSVWGFQRESTLLAPGLTICLPSRFNKEKLANSRPAYQMLAYETWEVPLFDNVKKDEKHMNNLTELLEIWEKELESVTVRRARSEIGFTKKDIFPYAKLFYGNKQIDLFDKMMEMELESKMCWLVNWLLPDLQSETTESPDLVEPRESKPSKNDSSFPSETSTSSENLPDKSKNIKTSVNNLASDADSILDLASPVTNPLLSNSSNLVSTTAPSSHNSTMSENAVLESSGEALEDREGRVKPEDEIQEVTRSAAKDSNKSAELFRLATHDLIIFTVNLQQYKWHNSEAYKAGVELYLHDPVGLFWSVSPILLRPGSYNSIRYKLTNYKFLPPPFASFGRGDDAEYSSTNTECVDTRSSSFQNPMASASKEFYSSEMCMLEYASNRSTQVCGCTMNNLFRKMHEAPQCSILQHMRCYQRTLDREYVEAMWRLANGNPRDQLCPQACTYRSFEASTSASDFPTVDSTKYFAHVAEMEEEQVEQNLLVITIQPHGPLSVTVEHVPELTVLGILGSAGGWMGLCLGASLLTLTEFFEAVAMSVWILYRKLMGQLRGQA